MAGLLAGASGVVGATTIDVVKTAAAKTRLELQGFTAGGSTVETQFRTVLANDLLRSGWFILTEPGGAAIVVRGTLRDDGSQLRTVCEVSGPGVVYLNREFVEARNAWRELAHRVANAIVYAVKKVPGIAGTKILMIGRRNGRTDLYLCDADGENLVQLTPDGIPCLGPTWAPNGQALFYTTYLRGFPDVYRIEFPSRRRTVVANYPGMNAGATVSPDGRSLALVLSRDGNPELYSMDLKSGRLTRLTRTTHAVEASPTWSPDGQQLAYVSDRSGLPQIYVMDLASGRERCVTFRGSQNVAPDWGPAPDGRIAYSSRREGCFRICVWDPKTGEDLVLTSDNYDYEDPSWAPNGRHIVCSRSGGGRKEIWIVDLMDGSLVRLFQAEGEWFSPAWSPR
ncbi:MAG: DPP IV N-terminal domain-containing protein [Kiritimatiellia bacterium]